ncbi:adenosylcobinamide-GDP ribazoletransferase [Anaerovorax odorimutans]|uniref:Adenosylcobinamide-GDP ribazoletransferase n=1 Tax=Anaerovorax odorimutans TaxID=109327 RepID=A0ABT1RND0_9FIRM|nr:adenosylcobinamide-GDP ribazoletransferase [Anaerovorax odorimutans]MCQ4636675.1 adenosylcobinamide-GDP ribazoletransferase [Anaerovorax odorimutans]
MKAVTGFFMAWGNFCAIPCPCKKWDEDARKHMLVMFPVIGLMMGLLWYGLFIVLQASHIAHPLAAALLTAYPFLVSGFIHLDGFMDCNDAILSRRPLEERRRILKDSHVGAFAVITAILLFLVFFAAIWSALEREAPWVMVSLIAIPVLSRAASARAVLAHEPLSTSQYEKTFDSEKNKGAKWIVTMIWIAAALLLIAGGSALGADAGLRWTASLRTFAVLAAVELAASVISSAYGRKQLGGMSGDIAGFILVWSELAAVVSLAVI